MSSKYLTELVLTQPDLTAVFVTGLIALAIVSVLQLILGAFRTKKFRDEFIKLKESYRKIHNDYADLQSKHVRYCSDTNQQLTQLEQDIQDQKSAFTSKESKYTAEVQRQYKEYELLIKTLQHDNNLLQKNVGELTCGLKGASKTASNHEKALNKRDHSIEVLLQVIGKLNDREGSLILLPEYNAPMMRVAYLLSESQHILHLDDSKDKILNCFDALEDCVRRRSDKVTQLMLEKHKHDRNDS